MAEPEVENDRRALNLLHGMRRARKEGRYMGKAAVGYIKRITESGKKYIASVEPAASIMKWVFEELVSGRFAVEQIWKEATQKGLNCGRNPLLVCDPQPCILRKSISVGNKNEQTFYADGQHEPIISEALFYEVQDFLNGKKKTQVDF